MKKKILTEDMFCCPQMYWAATTPGVPILASFTKGDGALMFGLLLRDIILDPVTWSDAGDDAIDFCPFCGKKVSIFQSMRYGSWKHRNHLCGSFLYKCDWSKDEEMDLYFHPMPGESVFVYNFTRRQMYLRAKYILDKTGDVEGFIPIDYCPYCGEPFAYMLEKYGIPDEVKKIGNHEKIRLYGEKI